MSEQKSKKIPVALGVAGFLILLAAAPCILGLLGSGYYAGSGDMVGMAGLIGLALLGLFLGVTLLYQAFTWNRD